MAKFSRRFFNAAALVSVPALFRNPVEALPEVGKVISDPEILSFYTKLLKDLKDGKLDYSFKDTFDPVAAAHSKTLSFPEGTEEREKAKYSAGEMDKKYLEAGGDWRDDNFDDVPGDKRDYICKNRITYRDALFLIDRSKVVLFGEIHTVADHQEMELRLLGDMEGHSLCYACEDFGIDMAGRIEGFLGGKCSNTFLDSLDKEAVRKLEAAKKLDVPVVVTDLSRRQKEDITPGYRRFSDPKRSAIRERVFARQILYAAKKGYRAFGTFGDAHVQSDAIPKHLKAYGIEALVITTSSMSPEVYHAAMDISGGDNIFFRRNGAIVYASKDLGSRCERYKKK